MEYLSGQVPLPVIDRTDLKDRYTIQLELPPSEIVRTAEGKSDTSAMQDAGLTRIMDAVEKIGLKLERRKNPVETVVVDQVERIPTEN